MYIYMCVLCMCVYACIDRERFSTDEKCFRPLAAGVLWKIKKHVVPARRRERSDMRGYAGDQQFAGRRAIESESSGERHDAEQTGDYGAKGPEQRFLRQDGEQQARDNRRAAEGRRSGGRVPGAAA